MPMVPAGVGGKWSKGSGKRMVFRNKSGKVMAKGKGKLKAGFRRAYAAQTAADFAQVARVRRMAGPKRGAVKRAINRRRAARKAA